MPGNPEDTHPLGNSPDQDQTGVSSALLARRPPGPQAYLVQVHPPGPGLGLRHPVPVGPAVIGREAGCEVVVPDPAASRRHARVEARPGGGFRLTDLGSRNGTYINHARVASADLGDGDDVRVGDTVFRFLAGGDVEAGYREAVHRLAVADPLTGLPNRRAMAEFLDREVGRARRRGRPLSVALIDVDHFRAVNDRLGSVGGDNTLRAVARLLGPLVRADELLARAGGDEFAAVLPEADAGEARAFGERVRWAVAGYPFGFEGTSYRVTVSVGVGVWAPGDGCDATATLARASERLREAKRSGRDRVCG